MSFAVSGSWAEPETTGAAGWQVLESHGGVRYRSASEPHWWPARTGIEIPDGSSIVTGGSGFLIIARAGESITLRTNSSLQLQGGPSGGTVQQTAGNLRYRITHAPDRRFGVETPYLSLMVKGTVFDVAVSDHGAEIGVTHGRVRVDTPSGQIAELDPGQSARIATGTGVGLEVRADPESPFTAAPAPGRSIAAAYPRQDLDREPVNTGGQGAPTARSAETRLALRTVREGPSEAPETPNRSTAMAPTHGGGIGRTDRQGPTAPGQAANEAFRGADSGSGASGAGLEITADGVRVDGRGPEVAELSPDRSKPTAASAGAEPESGAGRGSAVAAASPPNRSIAAAAAPGEGDGSTDRQRRNASDQATDRSDHVSSGGGTGDRVAIAVLVLVLLAAVVWWRRQRQMTVSDTGRGRGRSQLLRVGTSPGAPSSDRSSTPIRAGTRRSTTHARL